MSFKTKWKCFTELFDFLSIFSMKFLDLNFIFIILHARMKFKVNWAKSHTHTKKYWWNWKESRSNELSLSFAITLATYSSHWMVIARGNDSLQIQFNHHSRASISSALTKWKLKFHILQRAVLCNQMLRLHNHVESN